MELDFVTYPLAEAIQMDDYGPTLTSSCVNRLCPHISQCPDVTPNATDYIKVISNDPTMTSVFTVFGVLCVLTLFIYIFEIISILKNKMHIMRRIRTVMLLSLYPAFSILALFAVIVPRSAPLLDLVANVYFAITLWHFIQLMMLYYGGETRMIHTFDQTPVSIQTPPICCIVFCFPKVKMTKSLLYKLKMGAAQFLVIRPVLLIVSMILWVEGRYEHVDSCGKMDTFRSASTYISLVNMGSTLFAMWPLIIIFRASMDKLAEYHIRGKFIVFQLVMICGSMQDAVLTQVANFNLLCCNEYLPVKSRALEMHHLAIIGEMFILSVAALAVYWRYIRESPLLSYPVGDPRSEDYHEDYDDHSERSLLNGSRSIPPHNS